MREARVLRAGDRYVTTVPSVDPVGGPDSRPDAAIVTHHAFSFGDHYDPDNTHLGPLTAVNEELVAAGQGYEPHRHSDVEIVTWVLEGALQHEDSAGHFGTIGPGEVQHLSAGGGVEHTERNASSTEPLHFIQMSLVPSAAQLRCDPLPASYQQVYVAGARGRLLSALRLRDGVEMSVAFLDAGDVIAVPSGGPRYVHVARGDIEIADLGEIGVLEVGDSVRVTGSGDLEIRAATRAEVLGWQLSS